VEDYLPGLPSWLSQDIADFGLDVALDQTIEYTKNFTAPYFIQEMQGTRMTAQSLEAFMPFCSVLHVAVNYCVP
jgi:hypothetical protein